MPIGVAADRQKIFTNSGKVSIKNHYFTATMGQ